MKMHNLANSPWQLIVLLLLVVTNGSVADATVNTRIGELKFDSGYPTDATARKLYDEMDFQRAVQAYLWAMPFVSYAATTEATLAKGANNHTKEASTKIRH